MIAIAWAAVALIAAGATCLHNSHRIANRTIQEEQ